MTRPARWLVLAAGVLLSMLAVQALLDLGPIPVAISEQLERDLPDSGVVHPVTAVLLNFRGYDTLLEIAVLMATLAAMLAVSTEPDPASSLQPHQAQLAWVAAMLVPLMVLVAGYLLWAGATRPGGAFQAAAVLAAAAVLLHLSGAMRDWPLPGHRIRTALSAGLLIFLTVAGWPGNDTLLQFPDKGAGELILLIESGLTFSLALLLAGLFLWQPDEREEPEQ